MPNHETRYMSIRTRRPSALPSEPGASESAHAAWMPRARRRSTHGSEASTATTYRFMTVTETQLQRNGHDTSSTYIECNGRLAKGRTWRKTARSGSTTSPGPAPKSIAVSRPARSPPSRSHAADSSSSRMRGMPVHMDETPSSRVSRVRYGAGGWSLTKLLAAVSPRSCDASI